jgi:hypothetical protein
LRKNWQQVPSPLITTERAIRDAIVHCVLLIQVEGQEIGLIHQSMRGHFVRKEQDNDLILSIFQVKAENAHLEVAKSCSNHVLRNRWRCERHRRETDSKSSLQGPPILEYAVRYWLEHARCFLNMSAKLISSSGFFFRKSRCRLREAWSMAHNKAKKLYLSSPLPSLHIACYLGIVPCVETITLRENGVLGGVSGFDRERERFQPMDFNIVRRGALS